MNDLSNNKNSISADLFDLAMLLDAHSLISDAKSLYEASEKVRNSASDSLWEYECNNLKFSVEGTVAGTIPKNIELLEVIFNINIKGIYFDDKKYSNPLSKLTFDLELEGYDPKPSLFYASWHLDKHIRKAGDNLSAYSHPEYHLTFGGNKMEEKGNVFGDCLILPSPRILHPPMDAILGIDFILQNYFPLESRKDLMADSRYKEIICNSQNRLWKPYFTSISSAWNGFPAITFEADIDYKILNPFLDF